MPGVIFDLDGVLIDSEGLQYKSYSQVLARWNVSVSREDYAHHWIASGRGPEHAVATYGLPLTPDALRELKHPIYHQILRQEVTLMPGVRAALQRLKPHFRIGLATNSNRLDVDFVMDHFELRPFFDEIVGREDYTRAKPEPDAFTTAAQRLGLASAQCVVIEDAHKGVLAATRAGSPVIAIPNEWTRANDFTQATRILTSLEELQPEVVNQALGQSV